MIRTCLAIVAIILAILPAAADPATPVPVPASRVVPPPVDLPIIAARVPSSSAAIVVAPIRPEVVDQCVRGTVKMPVTWPPAPARPRLDCEGLRPYGPFEITPPEAPAPLEPPTLRLRDLMRGR